jgi:hypothetical protein
MENVGCLYRGHNPGFHDRACRSAGGGAQSNGGRARPDAGHKHSLGGLPLLALAIPLFFLFTGLGARLRRMCESISGRRWFWTVTLFVCAYLVLAALIALPFDYFVSYIQLHTSGWPHQTLPDVLKADAAQLIVRLVLASLLIWLPYRLIARSPRRWWLYCTLALGSVRLSGNGRLARVGRSADDDL